MLHHFATQNTSSKQNVVDNNSWVYSQRKQLNLILLSNINGFDFSPVLYLKLMYHKSTLMWKASALNLFLICEFSGPEWPHKSLQTFTCMELCMRCSIILGYNPYHQEFKEVGLQVEWVSHYWTFSLVVSVTISVQCAFSAHQVHRNLECIYREALLLRFTWQRLTNIHTNFHH